MALLVLYIWFREKRKREKKKKKYFIKNYYSFVLLIKDKTSK